MTAQTILPANSVTGGYEVSNSLRFNSGSSDALSITPGSASNRKTFTISYWVKRAKLGAEQAVCGVHENSSHNFAAFFNGDDQIEMKFKIGGANNKLQTNAKFRDTSAWYHIVLAVDTTDGTAANRFKLYVNGVQVSSFDTATYPNADVNTEVNLDGLSFKVGRSGNDDDTDHLDGYLAEFCLIDGLQLAPTSFGEFDEDSNIWKPINVSGLTFGTNGLYLEFKGSGTSANSSGMGADTSGNDNHLAVANLTALDQSTDTCTNNFATLNPLNSTLTNTVLSEGNLKLVGGRQSAQYTYITGTIAVSSGKWYWEVKAVDNSEIDQVGVAKMDLAQFATISTSTGLQGAAYGGRGVQMSNGNKVGDGSQGAHMGGFSANNICMIALDLDNNKIIFGRNGSWSNGSGGADQTFANATAAYTDLTAGAMYVPAQTMRDSGNNNPGTMEYNFGNAPYAISSGNTDGNGFGNFEYAVPSGYFSLCTKNLAENG